MRPLYLLPLSFVLALTGCGKTEPAEGGQSTDHPGADASEPPAKAAKAEPYRLLGILDPERDRMVAFAMKVPGDWQVHQSFQRRWEGSAGFPQISLTLRSPDNRSQIEYLPSVQYLYSEGPMTAKLREQARSLGMPPQTAPNERAPMSPTDYIKQVLMPDLARRGQTLSDPNNERAASETRDEHGQLLRRGSVDGTLPNGNRARVECRISVSSRQLGSDTYHAWNVVPSITQTDGDLEAIHTHTRVAQDSIIPNPAWLKLEQEAQSRGLQANREASRQQHEATMNQIQASSAAMTRAHEQRMNDIRSFGEANTARFNDRMDQMDRDQRIRVDAIRGETKYADPTTGERVQVEDGYNHVYRNRQDPNIYYGTDTPINAGEVDWQELQKVQLKDY